MVEEHVRQAAQTASDAAEQVRDETVTAAGTATDAARTAEFSAMLAEETAGQKAAREQQEEKQRRQSTSERDSERRRLRYHSLSALYRKEMGDHVTSRRFVIILILIVATTVASVYGAISGIRDGVSDGSIDTTYLFLKLYTTSGNSIPSYMSLIALIGPFIGLILGFDAINSERANGTLNRLVAQPIYRDSIIIGKFLSGSALIALMILATGISVGAAGFLAIGILPDGEQLCRVAVYLVYTIFYVCFWLAMAILFSVICRHAATSALASIALWVFFAIFMSLLASIIANAVYPMNNEYQQMLNALDNTNLTYNLNRISPYYLYSEASSIIMNPSSRAINAVTYAQLVGAISGYLSIDQSLLLVWPHLVGLIAMTLIAFAISYVAFMRQEVRGT